MDDIIKQVIEKTTRDDLLSLLYSISESAYRDFMSRLLPGVDNIIGVRIPMLRKIAKQLSSEQSEFLNVSQSGYYEEKLLRAFVIGNMRGKNEDILREIEAFVLQIDNWSVCDSFCSSLKIVKSMKPETLVLIDKSLNTYREFSVRFALVMLLTYYKSPDEIDLSIMRIERLYKERSPEMLGYYAKMAAAWALSVFHTVDPARVNQCITQGGLDDFTRKMALRKISELSASKR